MVTWGQQILNVVGEGKRIMQNWCKPQVSAHGLKFLYASVSYLYLVITEPLELEWTFEGHLVQLPCSCDLWENMKSLLVNFAG